MFWPIELAPADEIPIRLAIAIDNVEDLVAVLERGSELGCFSEGDAAKAILTAFPPGGWFTGELFNWLKNLPEHRSKHLSLFGPWSAFDVVELRKARAAELNGVVAALVDTGHALYDACALAVAGHDRLAYVAIQMVASIDEGSDHSVQFSGSCLA